ncbi:MAG: ABC-three component system protein [Mucilaginibacter sp.]
MSLLSTVDFPKPSSIGKLTNQDIFFGPPVPAIDRLKIFSPEQFEDMIREWVTGYLIKGGDYKVCKKCSGAGDMGRDVIAQVDDIIWDNYQCKHYGSPLAPSEINSELGKLVYYTHKKKYTLPRRYYFVSPKGAGPKFNQYLENPKTLKEQLILNWDKHCKDKIKTNEEVSLTEELLGHLKTINFSIFESYDPQRLIDEHANTSYHASRFGGGLQKRRDLNVNIPIGIQVNETVYTSQLFLAYSDHIKTEITEVAHLNGRDELQRHFRRQRLGYYSADSLNQFSRDTLPNDTDYFEDLKDEFYAGVVDVAEENYKSGFERVKATTNFAKTLNLNANPLVSQLRVADREGICHHLANEKRLIWVTGK